jgi:hypothetical protein
MAAPLLALLSILLEKKANSLNGSKFISAAGRNVLNAGQS